MSAENQRKPTLRTPWRTSAGRYARCDHIIAEGVPERFAEILRRLDEPSNEGSNNEPTPPKI